MIDITTLSFEECIQTATILDIEPCLYCQYSRQCNHNSINNYGNGPVESYCVPHDLENWVDEEKLRESLNDYLYDCDIIELKEKAMRDGYSKNSTLVDLLNEEINELLEKEIADLTKIIESTFDYAKKYYTDKYEPFELNVYPDEIARIIVENGFRKSKGIRIMIEARIWFNNDSVDIKLSESEFKKLQQFIFRHSEDGLDICQILNRSTNESTIRTNM